MKNHTVNIQNNPHMQPVAVSSLISYKNYQEWWARQLEELKKYGKTLDDVKAYMKWLGYEWKKTDRGDYHYTCRIDWHTYWIARDMAVYMYVQTLYLVGTGNVADIDFAKEKA